MSKVWYNDLDSGEMCGYLPSETTLLRIMFFDISNFTSVGVIITIGLRYVKNM